MKEFTSHFNAIEIPVIASQILRNYKRDRSLFEQYSPKFNHEFLASFEEIVNNLTHPRPLTVLKKEITEKTEKIHVLISHFLPLISITEDLIRGTHGKKDFPVSDLRMLELKNSVNKNHVWEIQRSCRKIVSELELNMESIIDKGFLFRVLDDFNILLNQLKNAESELANLTHLHDMISEEYLIADNQINSFLETIIESSHDVFGEHNSKKRSEYSIEKLMTNAQFRRSESQ
ncbi:MAG: hypothetical protein WCL21_02335 [Mariniphaga sp.]